MAKVSSLGHVGIYAHDMDRMLDFYTRVLGLKVTDGGQPRTVFMSAQPEAEHHEFVLGPAPDRKSNAQQVSFTVSSLDDLKALYRAIRDYGCQINRVVNHGIAFGCYFRDPEDNQIEVYWPTGIDYPQPHADPLDLDLSNADLLHLLESMPPKESRSPRYYGRDLGKRLPAAVRSAN
jgi:catechol 2,3-dioxygenase-like lactoylglutathione lyase family enzyme